ncbi:hypothetical protein KAF44_28670 (plasmid) [Cupriavidus necator]|nr:hypothetical protein KAF44_28670 [Cupriavidus necator]
MKVRVEGPITAERLAEAVAQAATLHEGGAVAFAGFYGATLYLHAYTDEGEPMAVDQDGKEMALTVRAPAGTVLRPPAQRAGRAGARSASLTRGRRGTHSASAYSSGTRNSSDAWKRTGRVGRACKPNCASTKRPLTVSSRRTAPT